MIRFISVLLLILSITVLPVRSDSVTVKRKTAPQTIAPKTLTPVRIIIPIVTPAQRLKEIKQDCIKFAKSHLPIPEDDNSDVCRFRYALEAKGAKHILISFFNAELMYPKKVKTGLKLGDKTFRKVKECVKVEFEFESSQYETGWCK